MAIYEKQSRYYIDYYYQGRRIRECVGPSKKLAQQALAARKGEIAQGRFDLRRIKGSPFFHEFIEEYLEYCKGHNRAWKRKATHLRHFKVFFGSVRLHQITPWLLERYKAKRQKDVTPATVNRELGTLKHLFNLAIKWERVDRNPVREVKFFREANRPLRFLSEDEISRVLAACNPWLRAVVVTGLNTGMRRGEILSLRWNHVDFSRRVILVEGAKTDEHREIPMNARLTETLKPVSFGRSAHEPVFVTRRGEPYREITKAFKRAVKKAGIAPCRFHDLRHTFASHLVMKGADLVTVKELLGAVSSF